ncbi:hypothetical protein CROQUDRAFT_609431 [Cronartium quercuum f. sp. fusiforme G11]|uniref:Uncharacterized protein n=1 Tax=Cronartium quercuum f. sp. fusiforme G11 TaxID=708437 RepID=A0A9P6NJM5_9BASI|nr:hypothetical protein CROQUDRAFT_609431 [Cronartium quercuum f. sp. fusiforme G11]
MTSIISVPLSNTAPPEKVPQSAPSVTFPQTLKQPHSAILPDGNAPETSTYDSDRTLITPPLSIYPFATPESSLSSANSLEKKRRSVLRNFSVATRRSLAFSSQTNETPSETNENVGGSKKFTKKSKRTLSLSSPFQRFKTLGVGPTSKSNVAPVSTPEHRSTADQEPERRQPSKGSIGKGIRNVARTVKRSFHQLDHPLSLLSEPKIEHSQFDKPKQPETSVPVVSTSEEPSSPISNRAGLSQVQPIPSRAHEASSVTIRTRAISVPGLTPSNSASSRIRQTSSHQSNQPSRPASALEPISRVIPTFGSLPQVASLLARPEPDPATFLAIIPGQVQNGTLVPPPSASHNHFLGDPTLSATTARFPRSIDAQPALSSRGSFSSDLEEHDQGFAFIRSPEPEPTEAYPERESETESDRPRSSIEREQSYPDTGSVRRVPSELDEFSSHAWNHLMDRSTCYSNPANRHQPVVDSSSSGPVTEFEIESSTYQPVSGVEEEEEETKLKSVQTRTNEKVQVQDRMLDIARLPPHLPIFEQAIVIPSWRAPANWETSLVDNFDHHNTLYTNFKSHRSDIKRKVKVTC